MNGDHSKGVTYKLFHEHMLKTGESNEVAWESKCLYDLQDYIVYSFNNFGENVGLNVFKPEDIDVYVAWFLTAKGKGPGGIIQHKHTASTSHTEEIEGVIVPGNGFILIWWPKIEDGQH